MEIRLHRRNTGPRPGLWICAICAIFSAAAGKCAQPDASAAVPDRFIGHFWSEIHPNLHYEYGCDTGWHSFSFRADGYFLYDRTVAGAWWLDHRGNLEVRANQGETLLLFFDGAHALTQLQRSADFPASVFGTDYRIYQECET